MTLGIILTVLGGGSALLTYALIERRINQRACPHCGFRVSVDALEERCPRCGGARLNDWGARRSFAAGKEIDADIPRELRDRLRPGAEISLRPDEGPERCQAIDSARRPAKHGPTRWGSYRLSRLALLAPPLAIVIVAASMTIRSWSQPRTEKAIRMVKSSSSRIENFTVQQYLYSTLFDKKEKGADVTIEGWQAEEQRGSGSDRLLTVEFNFTDQHSLHRAVWEVDLAAHKVTPRNEDAWNLSWNY